ncbi:hypothetical protein D9613_012020 [Agrocybe pediades]|uniref:Nephrocystin 3-like N-terminal domain-containing protein n=1 Tax=Agrocybe pediades TaxID=84607 RepID=A0A8H4VHD0_9AGAR|nr:hypothetical protein D9613_012020 [Agrocybe pediades]
MSLFNHCLHHETFAPSLSSRDIFRRFENRCWMFLSQGCCLHTEYIDNIETGGKSHCPHKTFGMCCLEQDVLLASFFFNRTDHTRNNAESLVATLAYQLYCAFPETDVQSTILSAIRTDPLIFKRTIQRQFTSLVVQPLAAYRSNSSSTQHRTPFLIMIDGLDECMDRASQKAILIGLAESMRGAASYLRIFIASRPEHDIRSSFGSKYLKDIHTLLALDLHDQDEADSDIKLYFLDRFAEIQEDFDGRTSGKKLGHSWPGERLVKMLVERSSGQFIYASTIIRYVESTRHRPDHRLEIVMNLRPHNDGDHPFAELDALYAMILEASSNIEKVLHVISLHWIDSNKICCHVIEKLLSYDEGELDTLFCDLGALVQVSHSNGNEYNLSHSQLYVHILHASLADFLLDAARSKQFYVDIGQETIRHIAHILQYFATCCSSSFDPNSIAATPLYVFANNAFMCHWRPISLELREAAFSFPLKEFLEPHTSTRIFPQLLEYFVSPFMELLNAIALKDSAWSYIRDHQYKILESILMHQLGRYFHDNGLALFLVLFYHLGSHQFVPILKPPDPSSDTYSTSFNVLFVYDDSDILSLSRIWGGLDVVDEESGVSIRQYFFHDHVRRLLRDSVSGPNAKYTLGPNIYEKAALACFKELGKVRPPSSSSDLTNIATDDTEGNTHPKLRYDNANGGQWLFEYSTEWKLDDEELYFVLLGYIIFLLPLCGKSDALVAACEKRKISYADISDGPFLIHRRLLHDEINNYLARVLPCSNV